MSLRRAEIAPVPAATARSPQPHSQRAVRPCACATSWVRSTTTGCSPPSTRIAARFLPAARGVSHQREKGVPLTRTEEQVGKKTGYARARFAKSGINFDELPDERAKWQARLRSWRQS